MSLMVVRTDLPRIAPLQAHLAHQAFHSAAGDLKHFSHRLPPDLLHAINREFLANARAFSGFRAKS